MSGQKKGFAQFIRPVPEAAAEGRAGTVANPAQTGAGSDVPTIPQGDDGRIRTVTSTGRVRTFSASRQLPGITLRVTEERWERLKMMSIQERRPLQEIVSEAMERYMRERGLPW